MIKKPQWGITSQPFRWPLEREISNDGKAVEKLESLCGVKGNIQWCNHYGGFSKIKNKIMILLQWKGRKRNEFFFPFTENKEDKEKSEQAWSFLDLL